MDRVSDLEDALPDAGQADVHVEVSQSPCR
jgi:hypothetical protein